MLSSSPSVDDGESYPALITGAVPKEPLGNIGGADGVIVCNVVVTLSDNTTTVRS